MSHVKSNLGEKFDHDNGNGNKSKYIGQKSKTRDENCTSESSHKGSEGITGRLLAKKKSHCNDDTSPSKRVKRRGVAPTASKLSMAFKEASPSFLGVNQPDSVQDAKIMEELNEKLTSDVGRSESETSSGTTHENETEKKAAADGINDTRQMSRSASNLTEKSKIEKNSQKKKTNVLHSDKATVKGRDSNTRTLSEELKKSVTELHISRNYKANVKIPTITKSIKPRKHDITLEIPCTKENEELNGTKHSDNNNRDKISRNGEQMYITETKPDSIPQKDVTTTDGYPSSLYEAIGDSYLYDNYKEVDPNEEEDEVDYVPGGYHPAYIGELYNNGKYVLVRKLGWGNFSTVWLARDRETNCHVAMKIIKSARTHRLTAIDEIKILLKINHTDLEHPGHRHLVKLLDYFDHRGVNGVHICMVFEVLGENLVTLMIRYKHRGLPIKFVKQISRQVLWAVDFLHRECGIIHTDIKPENVLLKIDDVEKLLGYVGISVYEKKIKRDQQEQDKDPAYSEGNSYATPSSVVTNRKSRKSRRPSVVFGSQPLPSPLKQRSNPLFYTRESSVSASRIRSGGSLSSSSWLPNSTAPVAGSSRAHAIAVKSVSEDQSVNSSASYLDNLKAMSEEFHSNFEPLDLKPPNEDELEDSDVLKVKLADLGNSCWIWKHFTSDIQTRQYRSPEVILGAEWGCSADIWSVGCMIFELLTGDYLFDPTHGQTFSKDDDHLAQIVELLGPLPKHLIRDSKYGKRFFHSDMRTLRNIKNLQAWPLESVLLEKYKFSETEAHEVADFLSGMLITDPKLRMDAAGLSNHYWLNDCQIAGYIDRECGTRGEDIGEGWFREVPRPHHITRKTSSRH